MGNKGDKLDAPIYDGRGLTVAGLEDDEEFVLFFEKNEQSFKRAMNSLNRCELRLKKRRVFYCQN